MYLKRYSNRHLYCIEDQCHVTLDDIYEEVRLGGNPRIEMTSRTKNLNLDELLLKGLSKKEPKNGDANDVQFLNWVIRNGGFINYIKALESAEK